MPKSQKQAPGPSWDRIIKSIRTPLGFFSLLILVMNSLFALLVNARPISQEMQEYFLKGIGASTVLFAAFVSLIAYFRPGLLSVATPQILTSPSLKATENQKPESLTICCVASPQWYELGVDKDIAIVKKYFRNGITIEKDADSAILRRRLTEQQFHILHLVCFVDPDSGSMIFSRVDLKTHERAQLPIDEISSDGFVTLTKSAGLNLVVLATCDSLLLAAKLARVVNVVAVNGYISSADAVTWVDDFYRLLSKGKTLSEAYDTATISTGIPMLLLLKDDMAFI